MLKSNDELKKEILRIFPNNLRGVLDSIKIDFRLLLEIRIRVNKPILIYYDNEEYFINIKNGLVKYPEDAYMITIDEVKESLQYICNYSLYAYENEIKKGFISVKGGNRIGICGKVISENGCIKNIRNISSINIRIAKEIKGCADELMKYIYNEKNNIANTLIISPPGCGKTTMLRDMIRQISTMGKTVGVVDERCEIGACEFGIPGNDLGLRTDILDACPKSEGIMMLIRSMSPKVIAVDEIGSREEEKAIQYGIHSGCSFISTIHADSIEEYFKKNNNEIFSRLILLSGKRGPGTLEGIYDSKGVRIFD